MKIVMIGSGNLATQLSLALQRSGHEIVQIYSKTLEHARCLAEKLHSSATNNIGDIATDADVYFLSVKDDALPSLIAALTSHLSKASHTSPHPSHLSPLTTHLSPLTSHIFLHTAGSVPMSVFEGYFENYGVFYPMQTFSKTRDVDFKEIPVFIEGSNIQVLDIIEQLAKSVSDKVVPCDSERRKYIHLAAVFACNMTNHCYRLCEQILDEHVSDEPSNRRIDISLFHPLIMETARKVGDMSPKEAQTGPMVRYDKTIMDKQLSLITNPLAKELYSLMAKSIHEDQLKD